MCRNRKTIYILLAKGTSSNNSRSSFCRKSIYARDNFKQLFLHTHLKNWTLVYMNLFTRNGPYYHLLKYLLFLLKHPVYIHYSIQFILRKIMANNWRSTFYMSMVIPRENTLIWKRKLWIALCGGTVLEEVLDLSSDRILNEWLYLNQRFLEKELGKQLYTGWNERNRSVAKII
jgi:hypothetical protein